MEELLAKYFSGEASNEEKEKVDAWRGASEENAKSFLDSKTAWLAATPHEAPNPLMLQSIIGEPVEEERALAVVPLWQQKSFQLAASVIVILGLAFYLLRPNIDDQPFGEVMAKKTVFDLPDGSEVTVQKGSSITMGDFKTVREVTITGKAYFDVERDEDKPFIIHTKSADVKVLGTSFVVNTNEDRLTTEVMVESGLVALAQNEQYFGKNVMEIQLKKGEMGMIAVGEKGIKKKKISDTNYLAWQNEILTFQRTRMSNVGLVLDDVYDLDVSFENPVLQECYLTAKFNKKSAKEVVDLIAETFNMTYEMNGDQVIFMGEGCQ